MRLASLQKVAEALGQEHSLALILDRIVTELARYRGVALARVWMFGPSEQCEICRSRLDAAERPDSLHLCASAGSSLNGDVDWSDINDEFHFGGTQVRKIREDARPVLMGNTRDHQHWSADWARRERIRSFAGYPLVYAGEQVGVIAVFARSLMNEEDFEWLRLFAVAVAGSIVRARAFDEIDKLRRRLESETAYLRAEISEGEGSTTILGSTTTIRHVLEQIEMVASTDATVLILGETGVGKELVARALHERGGRRRRPLIKVNCTAIPHELFESEFFGHVRGAFSGATSDRMGRFQLADRGSLFLDEIGDLPPDMQPKLLRVLQDGEFQPIGDDKPRHADVRIIAASNHDLEKEVLQGRFREDLYYRLSVFPIEVPPLRERQEDIPILATHFVEAACRNYNRAPMQFSASQLRQLQDYDWPGNIRELRNVVERAVIAARLGSPRLEIGESSRPRPVHKFRAEAVPPETAPIVTNGEMKRRERDNIAAALKQSGGRIYGPGGAAETLGMKPTTLNARIKKLELKRTL